MFAIAKILWSYRKIQLYSYRTIGDDFNRKSIGASGYPAGEPPGGCR